MTSKKEAPQPPSPDDTKSSKSGRRRIIKGLAAGGSVAAGLKGLPESWTRPMVDSIVLPAHAQLSLEDPCTIQVDFQGPDVVLTVTGNVTGPGDLGGLDIDMLVELLLNGSPTGTSQTRNNILTNPDGSYGPEQFTFSGACTDAVNGARVTVTSDSPGLQAQQGDCDTTFQKGCGKGVP